LRPSFRKACAAALAVATAASLAAAQTLQTPQTARVEARSASYLAVALVHDDRMSIHVSRLSDNAPVRDALVSVALRGAVHAASAETDGSYSFESKDLLLPGSASIEFRVDQGELHERLVGKFEPAGKADKPGDNSNARQLWWWALNFGVCIGVLVLISRRRKAAQD
jgi:hypothetical protein